MNRNEFTHIDDKGTARMVDVGGKPGSLRRAVAVGEIQMKESIISSLRNGENPKGDVLAVSRIAGIMAAKKVDELIPLCHTLHLNAVHISFYLAEGRILCQALVTSDGKTGVEMEALTAINIALLTIYDMCKAADKSMILGPVSLLEKSGGKSGHFKGILPSHWPQDLESEWQ
ncbi:MAG: cyclic pyranopterin monophosphate synthase MoaC [Nitrospinota bacterium]